MTVSGPRSTPLTGLSARLQEPRLYVLTYRLRSCRWWPFKIRHTWERVCTWDEALAMEVEIRKMGVANVEVRHG